MPETEIRKRLLRLSMTSDVGAAIVREVDKFLTDYDVTQRMSDKRAESEPQPAPDDLVELIRDYFDEHMSGVMLITCERLATAIREKFWCLKRLLPGEGEFFEECMQYVKDSKGEIARLERENKAFLSTLSEIHTLMHQRDPIEQHGELLPDTVGRILAKLERELYEANRRLKAIQEYCKVEIR